MNKIIFFLGCFVYEFLGNSIINKIPISKLGYLFYKYILNIECGKDVYFQKGIYIYSSRGYLSIGRNTIINRGVVLDRRGNLYVGNNVNVSPEVCVFTAGHDMNSEVFAGINKAVFIDDYVWLGTRSMVMPGVRIGRGAVVLPGAVVTKDIKPMQVVGGVPAKVVGERNADLKYNLNWRLPFG